MECRDGYWSTLEDVSTGPGRYGIGAPAVNFRENLPTYLRITDIRDDGTLDLSSKKSVADPKASDYFLKEGDIVFARTGNSTGRSYCYDSRDGKFVYAGFLVKFSIDSEKVNPRYIKYYVQSRFYWDWISSFNTGSTRGNINAKTYGTLPIFIPSRDVQDKIVAIADSVSEKIRINNRINDYLDQLIDCKFNSLLCEFENHKVTGLDWRIGTISEFVNEIISGDWGKDSSQANFTRQVRCVRGADIPMVFKGDKSKAPVRYILEKNFFKKRLFENDVIIEISGGSPSQSTGRSVYICSSLINRYEEPLVCTNFCRALRLNEDYSFYISCYFRYLYKRGVFFSYENGTTGIKNLDLNAVLNNENIVIPSKSVIDDFNKMYKKIVSMKYALGKENDRLSILRDALLPKLMSGEIDVSKIDLSS